MDRWGIVHNYRRCVEAGHAAALSCPECENILNPSPDSDGEPIFKCYYCSITYDPGLNVWDNMQAVVKEWYID